MPNPLDALRKASSIGASPAEADPQSRENWSPGRMPMPIGGEISLGPGVRSIGSFGEETVLDGLRRLMGAGGKATAPHITGVVPGASQGALQGLSRALPQATETLGEQNPYFTPRGGEEMYNLGKGALKTITDPVEQAYRRLAATMGK